MFTFDSCRAVVLVPRLFSGQVPVPVVGDGGGAYPRYEIPPTLSESVTASYVAASVSGIPSAVITNPAAFPTTVGGIVVNAGSGVYIASMSVVEFVVGSDWMEVVMVADALGGDGCHLGVGELLEASFVVCRSRRHVADYLSLCGMWARPLTLDHLDQRLAAYCTAVLTSKTVDAPNTEA